MIARLKEQAGSHSGVVADVLDAVAATIHVDEEDMKYIHREQPTYLSIQSLQIHPEPVS